MWSNSIIEKTTIYDMYKIAKATETPLLGYLSSFDFMVDYANNPEFYDRKFCVRNMFFFPRWNKEMESTDDGVLSAFRENVFCLLETNKNKYQRLYDLTMSEYNPIDNYDKTEVITTEKKGSEQNTHVYGNQSNTIQSNLGQRQSTENKGATSNTSNLQVGVMDGEGYYNKENRTDTGQAVVNTLTDSAVTDSSTETKQTHTDTDTLSFTNRVDSVENRTHGNIGVTTTAQMITGEKDLWESFSFYEIVFSDIIKELCAIDFAY